MITKRVEEMIINAKCSGCERCWQLAQELEEQLEYVEHLCKSYKMLNNAYNDLKNGIDRSNIGGAA